MLLRCAEKNVPNWSSSGKRNEVFADSEEAVTLVVPG